MNDYMTNVPVVVQVQDKQLPVHDLLGIEQTDLSSEYAAQAARYAYVAVLAVEARAAYDDAKTAREAEEAQAFVFYKNDAKSIPSGGRAVSDALADKLTKSDNDVAEAIELEAALRREHRLLAVVVRAFEMRADMLQSMGAHLRHEADMDGLSVRESVGENWKQEELRNARQVARRKRG